MYTFSDWPNFFCTKCTMKCWGRPQVGICARGRSNLSTLSAHSLWKFILALPSPQNHLIFFAIRWFCGGKEGCLVEIHPCLTSTKSSNIFCNRYVKYSKQSMMTICWLRKTNIYAKKMQFISMKLGTQHSFYIVANI